MQIRRLSSRSESTSTAGQRSERPGAISDLSETFDLNVMAELAALPGADGDSLLSELTGIFVRNLPEMLHNLSDAGRAGSQELARAAHRMKSAATTLGASRLAALCRTIEEACGQDDQSTIDKLLPEVTVEAARVSEKLKEIRSTNRLRGFSKGER
jgi:HPt (histidine-containing phosphotransfer) domain-containing protein